MVLNLDLDLDLVLNLDLDLDLVLNLDLDLVLDHTAQMNFRNQEIYKFAVRFLPPAARASDGLPKTHASLVDQLRRASVSISLNLAEGSGKTTRVDQRRSYAIARGSAMECAAIFDACTTLGLVEPVQSEEADRLLVSIVRMLTKLCRG